MTKSLTEKWKNGELELNSLWFVRLPCGLCDECFYTGSTIFMKSISGHDEEIWQVLAPVPSYVEYKQLVSKIDESDEELKNLACKNDTLAMENGKLQERLADADKALKAMDEKYGEHYMIADGTKMGNSPAWKYMLKWGVK